MQKLAVIAVLEHAAWDTDTGEPGELVGLSSLPSSPTAASLMWQHGAVMPKSQEFIVYAEYSPFAMTVLPIPKQWQSASSSNCQAIAVSKTFRLRGSSRPRDSRCEGPLKVHSSFSSNQMQLHCLSLWQANIMPGRILNDLSRLYSSTNGDRGSQWLKEGILLWLI